MSGDSGRITLGGAEAGVDFETEHGTIIRLGSRRLALELVSERGLARNFALLVPLPHLRAHFIWGHLQRLGRAEVGADGQRAHLHWEGLESAQGHFDIRISLELAVHGGEVAFRWRVDNRSGFTVEELRGPVIGGLAPPAQAEGWRLHWPDNRGMGQEWRFYRQFPGSYLGPADPVWATSYPGSMSMPWVDLYDRVSGTGVYFGVHRAEPRRAAMVAEITPGTTYAAGGQVWPKAERIGEPVAASLAWATFAFVPPHHTFDNGDVVLAFHHGDWSAGADRFRAWYDQALPPPRTTGWLHAADAWQSTIISYPEDTIGYRFADLPRMARVARAHGIGVLQIDGWDIGGIDRGYPQYTPDPRLGTAGELRAAIAACQAIGVRVLLFSNLQMVHLETPWWSQELHRYAIQDPFGNRHNGSGWEYGTLLGLQGEAVPRMVPANPAHPRFAAIIGEQLLEMARLGAAGTQIDKLVNPGEVDWHPDLAERRGVSHQEGILAVLERFAAEARALVPEFDVASESHWDRMVPHMSATYSRFFGPQHSPDFAHTFPEVRQSCCVTGPCDFNLVNNCLRYGHVINLEGRCLHGTAADMPVTARYAAAVLDVRRSLRAVLWDGRMRLPEAAGTRLDHDGLLQGHFTSRDGGSAALVLNHWDEAPRGAHIQELAGRTSGDVVVLTPGAAARRTTLPADVRVEPEQVVVVLAGEAVVP